MIRNVKVIRNVNFGYPSDADYVNEMTVEEQRYGSDGRGMGAINMQDYRQETVAVSYFK